MVKLELPSDFSRFHMPPALQARLQGLLDQQDRNGKLSSPERREARALTQLAELLTLMKLRAQRAAGAKRG
jgi:hypothetical protein